MKFFEFNDYEYYGLVVAEDEEKAKLGYEEVIAEIYEEEKELRPDIITLEEALEIYKKSDIEDCESEEEKIVEFHKNISNFKDYVSSGTEQYLVLLMDGSLN
ncbi:hypothetical protein [Clostridium tertium]|uniref:hypothetical protein n=1 Tax=Clostridium tertium TaxID=1559 RepID=UPI00374EDAE3